MGGKCHLCHHRDTRQPQLWPGCLWLLEAARALDALVLLPVPVLRNVCFPSLSSLSFSLPCDILCPRPVHLPVLLPEPSRPEFPTAHPADAGLLRYSSIGAVEVARYHPPVPETHRAPVRIQGLRSPAGNRPFQNVFMLVLKLIDSGTLYLLSEPPG